MLRDFREKAYISILDGAGVLEGCILPKWAIVVQIVFFPIKSLFYFINKSCGYSFERNGFIINKTFFSRRLFYMLSSTDLPTPWIRVVGRRGDVLEIETRRDDASVA